ncbi:hypothetical protein KJZ99_02160 [bacterium]|nr:hypothetical protein [bacterium]
MRILMLCLMFSISVSFADTRVDIQVGGVSSSSCPESRASGILAGSIATIAVTVIPANASNEEVQGDEKNNSPDWINLEFSYSSEQGTEFTPSSELYNTLNPQYFVKKSSASYAFEKWIYFYDIRIPESFAEREFCVRAVINQPPFSKLIERRSMPSEPTRCVSVSGICSDEDRNNMLYSYVWAAKNAGDYERAVELADSLVESGWRSDIGLSVAITAASALGNYETCLRFMDIMYQTYGYIDISEGPPVPLSLDRYNKRRVNLLQKIERHR